LLLNDHFFNDLFHFDHWFFLLGLLYLGRFLEGSLGLSFVDNALCFGFSFSRSLLLLPVLYRYLCDFFFYSLAFSLVLLEEYEGVKGCDEHQEYERDFA
jgi:hypothetical protein